MDVVYKVRNPKIDRKSTAATEGETSFECKLVNKVVEIGILGNY